MIRLGEVIGPTIPVYTLGFAGRKEGNDANGKSEPKIFSLLTHSAVLDPEKKAV